MTTGASSSSSFILSYDGTGLAEHSISIRQLGPALVALGALFDRSNYLMNGESATIDIKATATRSACFEIEMAVEMIRSGTTMFAGPFVSAALNIRQIVLTTITWLKYLNSSDTNVAGRPNNEIVEAMESVNIRVGDIGVETTAYAETNRLALQTVSQLSRDRLILEHFGGVFKPVSQDGIDRVDFKENDNVLESVEENDLPSFDPFTSGTNTLDFIIPRQMLKVLNPYLGQKTGQWRLHDGERTNRYDMMDREFANDVRNSAIEFRAEDFLECQVRQIQWIDGNGNIKTSREILRVLGHHRGNNGDVQLRITRL